MLSFSKLDASMLRLSPKTCLPDSELANSIKLFAPEFRRQDIEMSYTTDPGYLDVGVSWVKVSFRFMSTVLRRGWTKSPTIVVSQGANHKLSAKGSSGI